MNNVTVLGATGSIGTSTLDVIRRNPDRYRLFAATARSNVSRMLDIVAEFHPEAAVMLEEKAAAELRELLAGRLSFIYSLLSISLFSRSSPQGRHSAVRGSPFVQIEN